MRLLVLFCMLGLVLCAKEPATYTPNQVIVPGVPALPYVMDGNTKVFRMTAEPVTRTIFKESINCLTPYDVKNAIFHGKELPYPVKEQKVDGWGYNGSIPGPTIVACEGDAVRIYVTNNLMEPTTIHWHGLIIPNNQDGTGGTANPVIQPGKTGMYEFTIKNPPGTYMYHSGFNDPVQVGLGLGGFFIVLPKEGKDDVDKDYGLMIQEWVLPASSSKPSVNAMNYNWFTFNGLVAPNVPVLTATEGQTVRIRIGDLGNKSHPIHLHGYSFKITGTEGGPIPPSAQWPAATVTVSPGETRDILFTADNPGVWRLHCHILHHLVNNPFFYEKQPLGLLPIGGLFTYFYVKPLKEK